MGDIIVRSGRRHQWAGSTGWALGEAERSRSVSARPVIRATAPAVRR